ncbi:MAG: nucleoside kinase [Anaerolineae bacterium]|jgi:uridine kinase|nr:nucleoside kinase [Anaerolineae bacterium]MBT7069847.1 nucleoside kinase [Anaerolineae bacterium]MBT7324686.1 nucleoside kinase [Anaerolineae bacterium]
MNSKNEIKITEPSETVEVHLADGHTLTGKRGTSAGEFFRAVSEDTANPIIAAVVNGDLRELSYPIKIESTLKAVKISSADGARIYRRSLTFLLEYAFQQLFPKGKLSIDHSVSSGGYYCQVAGREQLSLEELEMLTQRMQAEVTGDRPFLREEVPLKEAIQYFEKLGHKDKVNLLVHRKKDYLTLYRLGEYMDYHHGYMVPSTGYLCWFDLQDSNGGFVLRFPRRHNPNQLMPMKNYPQLLDAFRRYGDWLTRLGIDSVGALNNAILAGRTQEIVLVSEALHEQHVADIANQIAKRKDKLRLILIAGPSSSGKTTFSRRLTVQLLALGISPFPLELDNYFVDRENTPRDENGDFDFEILEALNLSLLAEHLQKLTAGERVQLPRFNFKAGKSEPGEKMQLQEGQLIILEGIHGMNPNLIPASLRGQSFRIYVSALTQLNLDRHNRISTTDTRLLRRIVRDARERGYTAQETISRWESVRRGEKRHIFPYQENADIMFNSALAYELAALKPFATSLLRQVPHGTPEYIEAKRLLAFLEWFQHFDTHFVPDNSIAREFLGDSALKNFKWWQGERT